MGFDIYTPKRGRRDLPPAVRVSRSQGRLTLTAAAVALLPKAYTHVLLAFNNETRQIAFITTPPENRALRVTKGRSVSASAFIEMYDLPDGSYPLNAGKISERTALVTAIDAIGTTTTTTTTTDTTKE